MVGETCPDLDAFVAVNKYMAVTGDTLHRPVLTVVDFGRVINMGTTETTFLQVVYARNSTILYRGYAAWETPKFAPWKMLATATPPAVYDLPLAAGITAHAACKYCKTQEGIVFVNCSVDISSYTQPMIIASLPVGYRPAIDISGSAHAYYPSARITAETTISPTGNIFLWAEGAITYTSFFIGFVSP